MEPRYQHVVFNLLWQLWCSVGFENYRFKTVNLCLCDIFSSCDLFDAKSLVKNATSNYNTDPTGKISFRIFHVVSRNVLWWEVSIVGYFTFFQCFNDPQKKFLGNLVFLMFIVGVGSPFPQSRYGYPTKTNLVLFVGYGEKTMLQTSNRNGHIDACVETGWLHS